MHDLEFDLPNTPGALATLGKAMFRAGISFEGGGIFTRRDRAIAHYLFRDGAAAQRAAEAAGIPVVAMRAALVRKVREGVPGQLGLIARALADAGVNIIVQYSDHANQLILVCDQSEEAAKATLAWEVKPVH